MEGRGEMEAVADTDSPTILGVNRPLRVTEGVVDTESVGTGLAENGALGVRVCWGDRVKQEVEVYVFPGVAVGVAPPDSVPRFVAVVDLDKEGEAVELGDIHPGLGEVVEDGEA